MGRQSSRIKDLEKLRTRPAIRKVKVNSIYKHFKGNYYVVLYICKNSETDEDLVIYKNITNNKVWAKPLRSFLDDRVNKEAYPDSGQEFKFEYVASFSMYKKN